MNQLNLLTHKAYIQNLQYYSKQITNQVTVIEQTGKLEIYQASTTEPLFSKMKANWLDSKPPFIAVEK